RDHRRGFREPRRDGLSPGGGRKPRRTSHRIGQCGSPRLTSDAIAAFGSDKPGRTEATKGRFAMPMIDVYAADGTFADPHALAQGLATELMTIEQVPDIPMFRKNTDAFVHALPEPASVKVDGE